MESELLNVREVAKTLGVCARLVWKMSASGQAPKPVRLGRCVRWRVGELREWIEAGCPRVDGGRG